MDVNGTRFHLLLGARDWQPLVDGSTVPPDERLEWDARRGHLALRRRLFRFPARSAEARLTPEDRRGAGRDRFGHAYWISGERDAVRYRPAGSPRNGTFWAVAELTAAPCPAEHAGADFQPSPEPAAFPAAGHRHSPGSPSPRATTWWSARAIPAACWSSTSTAAARRSGGCGPRRSRSPPSTWRPLPVAVCGCSTGRRASRRGSGASTATCGWCARRRETGAAWTWRSSRNGGATSAPSTTDPRPVRPGRTFPTGISLERVADWASPLDALDPTALTVLPDGSVLLLEPEPPGVMTGDTLVHRLGGALPFPGVVSIALDELLARQFEDDAELVGHDFAFVPDADLQAGEVTGTLYVASAEGNQSFAFLLSADVTGRFTLDALDAYLPMRRFAGRALIDDGPAGGTATPTTISPTGG